MNRLVPSQARLRYGLKGPAAEAWLHARGVAVPGAANRVAAWHSTTTGGAGRCLRLGYTEFLVEHDGDAPAATPAADLSDAYLLLRSDYSLLLQGPEWPDALAQICSFDFRRLHSEPDMVVMTLFAGIAVTLVREPAPDSAHLVLRLWCDASYARYMQETLHALLPDSTQDPGGPR